MTRRELTRDGWIVGGALASLAALAFSLLRGHRLSGRIASGFAGAFLERWDDLRLEKRVASLLAKAEAEGKAPDAALGRLWGNP
jgi:hypothetical protein